MVCKYPLNVFPCGQCVVWDHQKWLHYLEMGCAISTYCKRQKAGQGLRMRLPLIHWGDASSSWDEPERVAENFTACVTVISQRDALFTIEVSDHTCTAGPFVHQRWLLWLLGHGLGFMCKPWASRVISEQSVPSCMGPYLKQPLPTSAICEQLA